MLKNKVIFLDLDGTFIDHQLIAPDSAIEAFKAAKANGHKIFMNTGRSACQVYDYLWELGFDGFIGGNGIYIEENGKELFHQPLPQDLLVKVYDYLVEHGIGFFEESNHSLFAHANYLPALSRMLKISIEEAIEKNDTLFPIIEYDCTHPHQNINKFSIVLNDEVDLDVLSEFIQPKLTVRGWTMFGNEREFADIYQKDVSKGSAVRFLMNHLGKPLSDAYSFGDGNNDLEMIQTSGTGIAMGNAIPELKSVADHVTKPIDQDGLWKAFRHFGLID